MNAVVNDKLKSFNVDADLQLNIIKIRILPFEYFNNKANRLPRKKSNGYELQKDTILFFKRAFKNISNYYSDIKKYSVVIIVYKGDDRLGTGDLDNYSKSILDAITETKKIWKDDKQVDELIVKRVYYNEKKSMIDVTITPHNNLYS